MARLPRASSPLFRQLSGATLAVLLSALGCGVDATAVESCQKIESLRCEYAAACPDHFSDTTVEACKSFYQTQCLHGIAGPKAPDHKEEEACMSELKAIGGCARKDAEMPILECPDVEATPLRKVRTVCDFLSQPERSPVCAFLAPASTDTGTGGSNSGGAGGAGGASSGGTAGTGGATGGAGGAN